MRPVSQLLRGRFYTTHLTVRCAEYHRCLVCGGCRRYDGNSTVCRSCEFGKPAQRCACKPSSLMSVRLITRKLGYEMIHADMPHQSRVVTLEEDPQMLEFIERNIGFVQEEEKNRLVIQE